MNPFETLGIEPRFDLDEAALERRYRELSRVVHPDRHAGGSAADRRRALSRAVDVNEAYRALRDPRSRAEALLSLCGVAADERSQKASQALLVEFLEAREELAEARASRDVAAARRLGERMGERQTRVSIGLAASTARLLAAAPSERAAEAERALSLLAELRYVRRFFEELSAIEEELG